MKKVVYGRGGPLLKFADKAIFSKDHFPEDSLVFGLVDEESIHGVCVFTDYRGSTVNLHVAGAYPGWINREFLRAVFGCVFEELKCNTALGLVRIDNPKALLFDTRLGFRVTGIVPKGDDDGTDFYLLAMTKEECRWIKKATTAGKEK